MANDQNIKILDDRSHALLRPGMYIGSTKPETQEFWVLDNEGKAIKKPIEYIPGQFKLFCEILDNAIDEHVRGFGNKIDVCIDRSENSISVRDYGRGIPLGKHKEAGVPTPQVVYTQLRAGSNFDDSDRLTIGMNGVGASLATVFSEKLQIEVIRDGKCYKQVFSDNMSRIGTPSVSKTNRKDTGTSVTFTPDKKIFPIEISIDLIKKRCLELSNMFPKLQIHLKYISEDPLGGVIESVFKGTNFEDFVKKFSSEYSIVEDPKKGFRLAICYNEHTEMFEQYSNVNGADTWRGGTHIEYFKELFSYDLRERIKKDHKVDVNPADVAKNMFIIMFLNWNAPQFEGQTKEKLVNDKKEVVSFFEPLFSSRKIGLISNSLALLKQATIEIVTERNDKKTMADIRKKQKTLDRKRIPKLIECSAKDRKQCSIYITEGDSAISNLATVRNAKTMAGLPLRGKILNVHSVGIKTVIDNKELQSIMASIGLKLGESPFKTNAQGKVVGSTLSYGKIIIATDQDMDGYSIRCLLINFFYKYWPELFDQGVVHILESPLYEALHRKKNTTEYFYDKAGFEKWSQNKTLSSYEISYFKGLGSCGKDAWNYMINKNPNLVRITTDMGKESKEMLHMIFGEDSNRRKEWLTK